MRKINAGLFITLDGVVEAPEKWNPPYYDEELAQAVMPQLANAGTHLYGRRSYELFRMVFTGPAAPPHAELMTSTPKVVVSAGLDDPGWGPTTVVGRDVTGALTRLKQEPGGDIAVGASVTLVRFLLQQRLLDELCLLVHPVVAGSGGRLFEEGTGSAALTLMESRAHRNGVVMLRYAPGSHSAAR
jgi:dihydrofolate reductase